MHAINKHRSAHCTEFQRLGNRATRGQLLRPPGCLKCATRQLQQLIAETKKPQQPDRTAAEHSHLTSYQQQQHAYQVLQHGYGQAQQWPAYDSIVQQLQPAYASAVSHNGNCCGTQQGSSSFAVQQNHASCNNSSHSSSSGGDTVKSTSSSRDVVDLPPVSELMQQPASSSWHMLQEPQQMQTAAESSSNSAGDEADAAVQQVPEESPGVKAALAMLRWYKSVLSPMMQSTCRFLPTCSQYSMDSYRKYGVAKGTVLTAWRLMRCNPLGPSGYDPTQWPPPGLSWLFQHSYSAEVAVVVGTAVFVRLAHALLFE